MKPLDIPATLDFLAFFGWFSVAFVVGFYVLWILYLAVMNLKRVKDSVGLTKQVTVFGMPVLFLGLAVDLFCNILLSVLLWELPEETTVTARLKRHDKESTGWRKAVAVWFGPLLNPFDPSGKHI